ncbi:MAG: glycosyltransferase [Candidatus Aminicenantes bacterium]|jgi:glycosyltransferase involved in cell wall biosynthesis
MISVVIPTFNRAGFLKEAIQSVLDQGYFRELHIGRNFEVVVVDDGSTDHTENVVRSFNRDIRYIYQNNRGVSAARNTGLRDARGDFIAFLDSDDLWKKDKIGIQMSLMNTIPSAMMCYTEEIWIRQGAFVNPKKRHQKYSGWIFDKVLPLCLISLSSSLFRKEVFAEIGVFDEDLPVCEDYDFGIRLAHRYPVYFLTRPLIVKRGGHEDQLSRKYWGMDRFRIKALQKALTMDLTPIQIKLVRREIAKKSRVLADGFAKRGKTADAAEYRKLIDDCVSGRESS